MNVAPDEGTAYLAGASCGMVAMQTVTPIGLDATPVSCVVNRSSADRPVR